MIKLNDNFYIDENYNRLCRFDGKEFNAKEKIKEILKSFFGYPNDGKIYSDNGAELTTNQYVGVLKRAFESKKFKDFKENDGKVYEDLLRHVDSLIVAERPDTLGHIFRHEYKENFISDWLAYLLSVERIGTNQLFQSLFDMCGIDGEFVPIDGIEREKELSFTGGNNRLEKYGRIDFFIRTENAIVGIENKIWSGFTSDNQLEKYAKAIKQCADIENKEAYLFLLYPKGNLSVDSKLKGYTKSENVKIVTYEELIAVWEKMKIDCIKSLRPLIIFEDFVKHIKEYIIMDTSKKLNFNAIKFLNEKSEEIEKLDKIRDGAKEQFICCLEEQLQKRLGDCEEWKYHISSGAQYIQNFKDNWEENGIHFELINKIKGENESNFPPKNYYLEFHCERVKDKKIREHLKKLSKEVAVKEGSPYAVNYDNEKQFENSIDRMIKALCDKANEHKEKIDEILYDVIE